MSGSMTAPKSLPARLTTLLDQPWAAVTTGMSDAAVWRIGEARQTLFLKMAPTHSLLSELAAEAQRLDWLAEMEMPAPRVVDFLEAEDRHWLLMTAVPGTDLTALTDRPTELCAVLASALRTLHAVDPAACPFDHRLPHRLAAGEANIEAGVVDEADFGTAVAGWSGQNVLDWLRENRPTSHDLVVTHGDASLPNIIAQNLAFTGFVDCARLGVADRWQDLALACWSVIHNCGEAHVATFLAAYGADWDAERYRYYCTLDELF